MPNAANALAAVAVSALASAIFVSTTAAAQTGIGAAHAGIATPTHLTKAQQAASCYEQLDNDNGIGIVSQAFEPELAIYDSRAADDFKLDALCTIKTVVVNGIYFNGSGPADAVKVVFYHSRDATRVGQVIGRRNHSSYTDDSGTGNFTIDLAKPFTFEKRTNWVSVKAEMDFSTGGEWGWNTNNTVRRLKSRWANPGDGFATGCVVWGDTVDCIPSGEGGDFSFALLE